MPELIQQLKQGLEISDIIEKAIDILKTNLANNESFFAHSLRTGLLLKEMGADQTTISAGILHEIPLDKIDSAEIKQILKKTYQLKELCQPSKSIKKLPIKKWHKGFLNEQAENLRRMFFVLSQDLRPILITLASRLDEMRHLALYYPEDQQTKQALVALSILAPLAYGIGMGGIKGELEDAAFPYLYAKEYSWLMQNITESYGLARERALETKNRLAEILKKSGIHFLRIDARAKHYFSLYQKLLWHNMDIDKIYDLVALCVVVDSIEDCYKTLGVTHNNWTPLLGRIKDYISQPKINGYRALHTTVQCPHCKEPVEIQIETLQMYQEAQYGAAAHLNYKEKIPGKEKPRFYWLDRLRQWQKEIRDPQKIADHLQTELFQNQIFVLTPKKEVINLPKGSTPIDFAYALHTDIGQHCVGAKVDNKMTSLKQSLQTGQVVEIITDKNKLPSSDWLRFAKTKKAKSKIRAFLEKAYGFSLARPGQVIKEKVSLIKKIIPRVGPKKTEPQIIIGGQTCIAIKLAKCCKPKFQDDLLAFITKGEGASVHQANCSNLKKLQEKEPQRIIEAKWTNQ